MFKNIIIATLLFFVVILFYGAYSQKQQKIVLQKQLASKDHEISEAYMKGIAAQGMKLPCDVTANTEYILQIFTMADNATICKIYPGP